MNARGLDLSVYNTPSAQNLIDWRGLGFCLGFARCGIGSEMDHRYETHAYNLLGAGYLTAPYHALHSNAPIVAQTQALLDRRLPGMIPLNMIDLEVPTLTGAMILQFFEAYDRLTDMELWVYTNQSRWLQYFPAPRQEFLRYGLFVAGYPYDRSDYDAAGNWQGQLMNLGSITLRSTPPLMARPTLPKPWLHEQAWQHTGHGRLAGYAHDLDLSIYPVTEAELRAHFTETPMIKLGPHHQQGGHDTARWLQEAKPAVAKAVGDLGVLQLAPASTLTVGRMTDDGKLEGQGFDANAYAPGGQRAINPMEMALKYFRWLEYYIDRNPWVDIWEGPNEQVIHTAGAMAWYAAFLNEYARLVKTKGKRAGIGGWSSGNPLRELNLWPHYVWALQAVRDHDAILTRHEYGPLDGFNSLRYRYDNAQFTLLGYPRLPIIVTECGADDAGGMLPWKKYYHEDINRYLNEWVLPYTRAITQDDYCLGATLFTVGGAGGWLDFEVDGTGLVERVIALAKTQPPVEDPMDETTRRNQIREHAQRGLLEMTAILDLVKDPVVVPAPAYLFQVKIITPVLNIRSGPASTFSDIGDALAGEVKDVYEIHPVNGWYRISPASAPPMWISGGSQWTLRV